jgi:hypothetical protein
MSSWGRQIPLRIWPIQLVFLHRILFRRVFSCVHSRSFSLVTFYDHLIFSILLQHHIPNLSKYFCSNFLNVQVCEAYKAMLQTWHITNFLLSSMFSDKFLLNASLAMQIRLNVLCEITIYFQRTSKVFKTINFFYFSITFFN